MLVRDDIVARLRRQYRQQQVARELARRLQRYQVVGVPADIVPVVL